MIGWASSILSAAAGIIESVVQAVITVVTTIFSIIEGISSWATQALTDLFNWVSNYGWNMWYRVAGLEQWAANAYRDLQRWATTEANRAIDTVRGWAQSALQGLSDWFIRGYQDLQGAINNVAANIVNTIANYVEPRLSGLSDWFIRGYHDLQGAISAVGQWAIDQVKDWAVWWSGPLWDMWHFLTDEVLPIWDKAVGIITFLAEHPLDWWLILLQGAAAKFKGNLMQIVLEGVAKDGSLVEDFVANWLGG